MLGNQLADLSMDIYPFEIFSILMNFSSSAAYHLRGSPVNPLLSQLMKVTSLLFLISSLVRADLVLETETAQLGKQGQGLFSAALQVERDKDGGTGYFTVNQFEVGLTDRSELLIEPFFYEWDKPKHGPAYSGVGDLEITPSYMAMLEQPLLPAVLFSCKVKVPTATNRDIGTGEFDYQPYVILGKTFDSWILNANLGYDFVTSPKTESLKNQFIYDLSLEKRVTEKFSVFAEIYGNTAPSVTEKASFAGAMSVEYKFNETYEVFTSVGYETNNTAIIRAGFNVEV